MGEKRGRIPAVASHLIDDEILKNKNRIRDDLSINKVAEGKCKSIIYTSYIKFIHYDYNIVVF